MMVDKSKGDDDNDRDQLIMAEMMMMMIQEGTFAIALVFPCSTAISKDSAAFLAWNMTFITISSSAIYW